MRFVSLVPSITETLFELGLGRFVVGCTHFCTHPRQEMRKRKQNLTPIGGTKDPDWGKLQDLNPTHVFVNTEENTATFLQELRKWADTKKVEVHESFPKNAEDSLALVHDFSALFSAHVDLNWVEQWKRDCRVLIESLRESCDGFDRKFVYLIWRDPWMAAGQHTYISELLGLIGLSNVIVTKDELKLRYPVVELSKEPIVSLDAQDYVFFSSEPFPFRNRHIEEFGKLCPISARKEKIDGRLLSWSGTSLRPALRMLSQLKST